MAASLRRRSPCKVKNRDIGCKDIVKWEAFGKNFLCSKAYCFASVGWSVCCSVDKVMSTQYLLTPSFESCQTQYSECP